MLVRLTLNSEVSRVNSLARYAFHVAEYKAYATCANVASRLFFVAPREGIQDEFSRLHKWLTMRAHRARIRAERCIDGESNG